MLLLGLATVTVASLCSILQLSMDHAVMAFLVTWLGLIAIFEFIDFSNPDFPRGPSKQQ